MKRGLLSMGAALTLVVAALPTFADAQSPQGGPGGRGGGGPAIAAPGGSGGGMARGAPSVRSGPQGGGGGGQGYVARSGGAPQGGGQAYIHRGGSPQGGGQAYVQPGGGGNWQGGGNQHHRRHFRHGPVFGFAAPYPYYYGYTSPNYYYEEDDSCYELRYIRGAYRQVWVCE